MEINIVAVLCLSACDDGVRTDLGKRRECLREIARARQKIALRLVGQDIIRFAAEREHLFCKCFVKAFIEREVVTEDGVDDKQAAWL